MSNLASVPFRKSLISISANLKLYTKATTWKVVNFASKLKSNKPVYTTHKLSLSTRSLEAQKPFNHHYFSSYKFFFTQNMLPLTGGIPSFYLSDIKPTKNWKFTNIFHKSGDVDSTHVRLKPQIVKLKPSDFKQTICRKIRLRLMRLFLNRNLKTPMVATTILNFRSLTKRLAQFKPTLKRSQAPTYITKWKTSYPLMFTNNIHANKLLKPQLDVTIKTFIQSRNNRRVRRFKKILFRKIKRHSRDKRSVKYASTISTKKKKQGILTTLSKNRLRNRKNLLFVNTPRLLLNSAWSKTLPTGSTQQWDTYPKWHNQTYDKTNYQVYWNSLLRNSQINNHLNKTNSYLIGLPKIAQSKKKHSSTILQIKYSFLGTAHQSLLVHQLPTSILKVSKVPYIRPRTDKNFIFKNFGIFLTSFILFNQKKPFTYKYLFKKKIFSFLYPNEVRNALMARKKRIIFYQLIYKIKHKSKQKTHYSFTSFNKFFINHYKTSLKNNSNTSTTQALFSKPAYQSSRVPSLTNYVSSRDEILYDQNFTYRGVDLSFKRSEVKIPRVRFRPGYQRMWRKARSALKESMGLKFVYQQQLTRCLVRFYKNSNKYSFARSEMSVNRIIMYSRLLPDNPTVNLFIDQKLIYLNGRLLHTQQTILVSNDLIQLIVSVWYYVAYRWISNWTLKRHKKFKKLVYRKGLAGKHKVMKLKKQRSYYTPNWIYLARYDISDIKSFLEVDYFTLSAFVLYEPFMTYYYTPDESPDFRPNIYRMYNWKYIT